MIDLFARHPGAFHALAVLTLVALLSAGFVTAVACASRGRIFTALGVGVGVGGSLLALVLGVVAPVGAARAEPVQQAVRVKYGAQVTSFGRVLGGDQLTSTWGINGARRTCTLTHAATDPVLTCQLPVRLEPVQP